ncbi:MAG TPA: PIN/TRAM domain-containing protein [Bacillota bacterium]|nr:PIN/TRAM domain-containing protein [Bacillota bacterium]HPT67661.1 PIN/TRAM domain-containing protein [Bacillota bacterium]
MLGKLVRFLFALLGAYLGYFLTGFGLKESSLLNLAAAVGVGFLLGFFLAGLFLQAVNRLEERLQKASLQEILSGAIGLCFGLVVAGLIILALPVTRLSGMIGNISAIVILLMSVGLSVAVALRKREELLSLLNYGRNNERNILGAKPVNAAKDRPAYKVLDTSSIIDGRIADLCQTGFLEGVLVIPGFVLAELQRIADSSDTLKRNRGRRGLDILNRMQKDPKVTVKILDKDFDDLTEVDTKLVRLARMLEAKVVTNDFNLNKVAELYGVPVLNINELANAIKPVVLPGEEMTVHIIKDGKEFGQGVAYLEDGTMIVIDGGKQYIGEELPVLVTSVLQTAAGRMIFAKPKEAVSIRASSSIS